MFKLKRKSLALVLILMFSVVALGGCGGTSTEKKAETPAAPAPAKQTEIILGTAGAGGTWYVLGSGIANVISKHNPDIKMTSSSTNGSVENLRLVDQKRIDIGMTQPPADFEAYTGIGLYKEGAPLKSLRYMCGGHYSIGQLVVRADSNIKTIADLKGKKVAFGTVGSGTRHYVGRGLLRLAGLDMEDIQMVALNQDQGGDALADGSVDAAMFSGGIPVPGLMNLAMTKDVRILPVPDGSVEKMKKEDPSTGAAMKYFTVPAGTYKGQTKDILTAGFITGFVVREDIPEETVYKILKTIDEYRSELVEIHPSGAEYTLETLASGGAIPFHPGSLRFFKEKGITVENPKI